MQSLIAVSLMKIIMRTVAFMSQFMTYGVSFFFICLFHFCCFSVYIHAFYCKKI